MLECREERVSFVLERERDTEEERLMMEIVVCVSVKPIQNHMFCQSSWQRRQRTPQVSFVETVIASASLFGVAGF